MAKRRARKPKTASIPAPAPGLLPGQVHSEFTVIVDTKEQVPYTFRGLRTLAEFGSQEIVVKTLRFGLPVGDYTIENHTQVIVERKSKDDLFQSMVDRANCQRRIALMNDEYEAAHWVIECEMSEIYRQPSSRYNPTSLMRSILAWSQRWPRVHWWFCPGRRFAEQWTYRLLERFHSDTIHRPGVRDRHGILSKIYQEGVCARARGVRYKECPHRRNSTEETQWTSGWTDLDRSLNPEIPANLAAQRPRPHEIPKTVSE